MAKYLLKDDNGRTLATLPNVLDPVPLAGVETTSSSNLVTVTSTTGLYAGMAVSIPNIPGGAFIHAVKSATIIELWASAWNATTGVFTTSAANAQATAAGSDLVGSAQGFNPRCRVSEFYARGTWRNLHASNSHGGQIVGPSGFELTTGQQFGSGVAIVPSTGAVSSGVYVQTAASIAVSDALAATPMKRHNGEPWSFYILVHTGGHQSVVPADPEQTLHYNGADA